MAQKVSPTQRVLNVWAVVLILWSFYRSQFRVDLPPLVDEFIAKPVLFLLPVYYYITQVEKKNFFEGVDLKLKHTSSDILLGLGIGLVFFATGGFAHFVKTGNILPDVDKIATPLTIGAFVAISLASAFSEEILSRGFVLKRLYEESKNMYTSAFFASILYFFLHIPFLFTTNSIAGTGLLQVMFTDLILSLAVGIIYLQRRNVVLPILIHAFYNLSIYMFM